MKTEIAGHTARPGSTEGADLSNLHPAFQQALAPFVVQRTISRDDAALAQQIDRQHQAGASFTASGFWG